MRRFSASLFFLFLLLFMYFCCRWKSRRGAPAPVMTVQNYSQHQHPSMNTAAAAAQPHVHVQYPFVVGPPPPTYASCVPPQQAWIQGNNSQGQSQAFPPPPAYDTLSIARSQPNISTLHSTTAHPNVNLHRSSSHPAGLVGREGQQKAQQRLPPIDTSEMNKTV